MGVVFQTHPFRHVTVSFYFLRSNRNSSLFLWEEGGLGIGVLVQSRLKTHHLNVMGILGLVWWWWVVGLVLKKKKYFGPGSNPYIDPERRPYLRFYRTSLEHVRPFSTTYIKIYNPMRWRVLRKNWDTHWVVVCHPEKEVKSLSNKT